MYLSQSDHFTIWLDPTFMCSCAVVKQPGNIQNAAGLKKSGEDLWCLILIGLHTSSIKAILTVSTFF